MARGPQTVMNGAKWLMDYTCTVDFHEKKEMTFTRHLPGRSKRTDDLFDPLVEVLDAMDVGQLVRAIEEFSLGTVSSDVREPATAFQGLNVVPLPALGRCVGAEHHDEGTIRVFFWFVPHAVNGHITT